MKFFLLSCALIASGRFYAQINETLNRGSQALLFQDLAPIKHDGFPIPVYSKSIAFHFQNKWALSNVNQFQMTLQSSTRRGAHAAAFGFFSHPGCHAYSLSGKESVRIGKNTALGLIYSGHWIQWMGEEGSQVFNVGMSYTLTKNKFYLQCNSVIPVSLTGKKQQRFSPQWQGMVSIQFLPEVALQLQSQFSPSGLNFLDGYLLWKYNNHWSISLGSSLPMGGWRWGVTYWLPKRQQGITFHQSAWVRPSLGYWFRLTS